MKYVRSKDAQKNGRERPSVKVTLRHTQNLATFRTSCRLKGRDSYFN